MSFSMLYFSMAWVAQSTASCCMSSDMSAFLITAFLSVMVSKGDEDDDDACRGGKKGEEGPLTRRSQPKMNAARGDWGWGLGGGI